MFIGGYYNSLAHAHYKSTLKKLRNITTRHTLEFLIVPHFKVIVPQSNYFSEQKMHYIK